MTTAMSLQEVMGSFYKRVTYAILSIVIVALIKKSKASHYTSHYNLKLLYGCTGPYTKHPFVIHGWYRLFVCETLRHQIIMSTEL